jgi:arylsulfatase A-like enzyme
MTLPSFFRSFLVAAGMFVVAASPTHAQTETPPPNILLVIADDMGLDVSPCYDLGNEKPDMPVLEAMCRDGLVFDNVWAEPVCSPTRATILTGRYGFRTGVLQPAGGMAEGGIRLDELSLQRFLDENAPAPYAHAVIGKWHLSDSTNGDRDNPELMGVGFYSGLIAGGVRDYYRFELTSGGVSETVDGYATTVFTDIAIDWLSRQQVPWFLWLAYNAPHTPFHVPPAGLHHRDLIDTAAAIEADPRPYYLAALEALDHETGRLLDSLDPATRENTIVIFLGDNGTPNQVAETPYTPSTAKGTLYPGGIAVPMVVSGAGVTRKGEREAAPVNTADLFATIADLAGVAATPAEDSISFRPLLSASAVGDRSQLYSDLQATQPPPMARNSGWTIREGPYQLLMLDDGARLLFNVEADPGGATNLLDAGGDAEAIAARLEAAGRTLRGDP